MQKPPPIMAADRAAQNKILWNQLIASHKPRYTSKYGYVGQYYVHVGSCLTAKQLSDALKVSSKTLERWRKSGKGPPFVRSKFPRCICYPLDGLDAWVTQTFFQQDLEESVEVNQDSSGLQQGEKL